ncbi:MAG: (2Fe-2S)-binding protein [Desulfobacterales bacterium]|nr:(2Fe-2S)-binding protein [Desulfobacterales bacterium]
MAKRQVIKVRVNGAEYTREVDSRKLLSDFIREDLELTGIHVGCEQGQCGACTILFNGVSVKSCLMFAVQAHGARIETIEGLAHGGKMNPLQEAFRDNHGLQCGFCTPGQLMSALYLLKNNPEPTEEEIRKGMSGNLCRCTGYLNIIKSINSAAVAMKAQQARA